MVSLGNGTWHLCFGGPVFNYLKIGYLTMGYDDDKKPLALLDQSMPFFKALQV